MNRGKDAGDCLLRLGRTRRVGVLRWLCVPLLDELRSDHEQQHQQVRDELKVVTAAEGLGRARAQVHSEEGGTGEFADQGGLCRQILGRVVEQLEEGEQDRHLNQQRDDATTGCGAGFSLDTHQLLLQLLWFLLVLLLDPPYLRLDGLKGASCSCLPQRQGEEEEVDADGQQDDGQPVAGDDVIEKGEGIRQRLFEPVPYLTHQRRSPFDAGTGS